MGIKRSTKKLVISIILLDLFICICVYAIYGPWAGFRNFWVTTSMTTMNHKYLAHLLYNEETIAKVMSDNTFVELNESTNPGLIYTIPNEESLYSDEYERQILKRDLDAPYKIIDISGANYKGFLIAIYDSSKIKLALSSHFGTRGDKLSKIAKDNDALVAINASGFVDPLGKYGNGGNATGAIVKNGKLIWSNANSFNNSGVIGFTKDNQLVLTKHSMSDALNEYNLRDAIEFGPFLIINGKPAVIKGNGGYGVQPRTAIAQRQDGIVLFLVIDGRRPGYSIGASMDDLIKILTNYKAYNAANLDGGGSTGLYVNDSIYDKPCSGLRSLPDAWIVTK